MTSHPRAPHIPRALRAVLDAIERDAILGDLAEEYVEQILPRVGASRARVWF